MSMMYVLDEQGNPVPEPDTLKWGRWFGEPGKRVVKSDHIGDVHVSTIFLGIDHSFHGGPPVLWETMIFGGEHDQYQERYTSLEDAKQGHEEALKLVSQKEVNPI